MKFCALWVLKEGFLNASACEGTGVLFLLIDNQSLIPLLENLWTNYL